MPEANATATDSSSLEHAASLFEQLESADADDTNAPESQQEVVGDEQPEQPIEDEVVEDEGTEPPVGDEEEEAAAVAEPRKIRVKLPEGEQELPEDEVARGYLRTADYTRKTQAHAENVKAFETEKQAVIAERQQYATSLTKLAEALKQQAPSEPDWDTLQQENPSEFAATWAAWQRHTQNLARVDAARKEAVDKVTQDQIAHYNAHLASERAKLVEAIPSWKNEETQTKELDTLFKYAQNSGYTEAELKSVADHRVMLMLRKAYLYDKGVKAKPVVEQKIEQVKAATPGPAASTRRPPTSERTKAKQRLAQTGSIKDAAALFEQMDES